MDVVNICAYAEGYYSGSTYEENISISKEVYDSLKDEISEMKVYISELDGKHSETILEVEIQNFTEDDIGKMTWESNNDGDTMYCQLNAIFKSHNLNLDDEVKKVQDFVDSLDVYTEITVTVRKSDVSKVRKYCAEL